MNTIFKLSLHQWLIKIFSGTARVPIKLKKDFLINNSISNIKFQVGVCVFFMIEYLFSALIIFFAFGIKNAHESARIPMAIEFIYILAFAPLLIVLFLIFISKKNGIKNKTRVILDRINTIILLYGASTISIAVKKTFIYEVAFLLISLLIVHPPRFYLPVYILNSLYMAAGSYFVIDICTYENAGMLANTISITILCFIISRLRLSDKIDHFLVSQELKQNNVLLNRQNKKLQAMTRIDGLTKIKNRRAFDEALKKEWARARRYGQKLGILMIDIDFFKKYNDCYGHQKGDDCLKLVAFAIKRNVKRASDMAARYGGEEFSVILTDISEKNLKAFAENLRSEVEELGIEHKKSIHKYVTISRVS